MTYAFTFDAAFCSGCKACQAACKDKNKLPLGVLWRRVYEVSGGDWQPDGETWRNTVFAYNLSMACNHCTHPKCAGVCPADAYVVRDDGVVVLDTSKCIGCGYCAWACPYGAPQYNPETGSMTKCDFCWDRLDRGLPPACVAACPLRVLGYEEALTVPVLAQNEIRLWDTPAEKHPYPLPAYSRTQPRLVIKPHAAMSTAEEKVVANLEEVQPRRPSTWEEAPLILFTLLAQLAVGAFWAILWIFPGVWARAEQEASFFHLLPFLGIGLCFGTGMLGSFAHLGTKRNAWRVLAHLRQSWLSREILFSLLFGTGWLATTLSVALWQRGIIEAMALTAALGFGLIYAMAQVYRLPAAPGWNTWRTNAGFLISALLLGHTAMAAILTYELKLMGVRLLSTQWLAIGAVTVLFLLAQLMLLGKRCFENPGYAGRAGLLVVGIILSLLRMLFSGFNLAGSSILIFLIVLAEEAMGRWSFYRSRL